MVHTCVPVMVEIVLKLTNKEYLDNRTSPLNKIKYFRSFLEIKCIPIDVSETSLL